MPEGGSATGGGGAEVLGCTAGFVLAGGRSSRMGRDKALLEIGGEPLVARICRAAYEAAGSAAIVGDRQLYRDLGFPVLPDRVPGLGPLGGLLTALENTTARWNRVLACDLPGITSALLKEILETAQLSADARCVAAVSERRGPEPLCAAYHRSCLDEVRQAAVGRRLRMRELVARLHPLPVLVSNMHVLENVNTQADWLAWKGPQVN